MRSSFFKVWHMKKINRCSTILRIYTGGLTSHGRQKLRFDTNQWSCHQRVKNHRHRTNNAVEGWNSNFVKLVNSKHLSFQKTDEKTRRRKQECKNAKECRTQNAKLIAARPKIFKYQKLAKNLITMIRSYQPNKLLGF